MPTLSKSSSIVKTPGAQSVKEAIEINETNIDAVISHYNTNAVETDDLLGIDDNCTAERLDLTDTLIDVLTGAKLRAVDGLLFGSDTAAANTLDDYEEGTWSGVISDGTNNATMTSTMCIYTKIGRTVFISGQLKTSSLGSVSGVVRITGLPFAAGSGDLYNSAICVGYASGLAISGDTSITATVAEGQTYCNLRYWDSVSGTTNLIESEWTADGAIIFSGHYIAA